MWGRTMATSRKISARRHAVRTFGLFVLGGVLASMGGGAPQVAAAEEVPAFAPGMIKHMQQMRRFKDVDKGPQPTPPVIPRFAAEPDPTGAVATFQPKGATFTFNNAFFKDLGTNGRTCFTCHQPQNGWSVSAADVAKRFAASAGADPIFRLVDGATCPNADVSTLAAKQQAYQLLTSKGLIRIGLPIPAGAEFAVTARERSVPMQHQSRHRSHKPDLGHPLHLPAAVAVHQCRLPERGHVGWPRT